MVKSILRLCNNTPFVDHYKSLRPDIKKTNIENRETKILGSDASMLQYYASIINVKEKSSIYSNFIVDSKRTVITRWRLSNHKLRIETGRYQVPYIERLDRKCWQCNILEDESHAIFSCPAFSLVRQDHIQLLRKYQSVQDILDPKIDDIYEVAEFLSKIDVVLSKR